MRTRMQGVPVKLLAPTPEDLVVLERPHKCLSGNFFLLWGTFIGEALRAGASC